MREKHDDTPPSSVNGDEITGVEEGVIYLDEVDEISLEDSLIGDTDPDDDIDMDIPDHSKLTFRKHVRSVFCCDLHPDGKIAATGGEDDKAYIWSVETGDIIMNCEGHKDSVIFIGFSFDGAYLCTADMGGNIKVWKCNTNDQPQQQWYVVFEYDADDISWGLWHFGARVLIFGTDNGNIYVFKIPSGETKVLQGHNIKVECGKLFHDGVHLAAGYEDGTVKIWNLKTSTIQHQIPADIHQNRITAIDIHPDNNLMASISTDGKMVLSTSNNGKVVAQLQAEDDLEVVAFAQDPQLGYFAIGTLTGAVSIWDSARQMLRHQCTEADNGYGGVTKMIWIKNNVVTGCLDGSLRVFDGKTGERVHMFTGHSSEILDLCYNAKENIMLTTSDDGTARIFKYEINQEMD